MIIIDGPLSHGAVANIARGEAIRLSERAQARISHARALVETISKRGIRAYGVNTGVGALCDTVVDELQQRELSRNIVMSHASGIGDPLPLEETRAIMACAINNYALGGSGVRLLLVERLMLLLNEDCIAVVPGRGSIGYITFMAHVALMLIGEGQVRYKGRLISARDAHEHLSILPLVLESKEGLSLVNGTPDTAGLASVALTRLARLLDWADVIAAMTFENIGSRAQAYSVETLQFCASDAVRRTGHRLTQLLADSALLASAPQRTQDAMCLRAVPQVHGAVRDCFCIGVAVVDRELASITDNPIVAGTLEDPQVYSGAHAIATGMALTLDGLAIAVAKIAAMSERRIDRLVNPLVSGLTPFLAAQSGACSGFMIAQYTALSLACENRRLAAPSSLDGGVSSGLQEDEIPHATTGALRLLKIIGNFAAILGIELLAAARAYEFQNPSQKRSAAGEDVYRSIRKVVAPYADGTPLADDIDRAIEFIRRETPPS